MSQFSLDSMTAATVASVNVRAEKHGEDHIPAADIAFKLTAPNAILDALDPALRSMLYKAPEHPAAETQPDLDGVEPVSDLPMLRCAKLDAVRLRHEFAGYRLTIDRGLGDPLSNVICTGCKVNTFRAACHEGGSVELAFRVQASPLDERTLGRLATLIGCEVSITLEAPEPAQVPIDASKDGDAPRIAATPAPAAAPGAPMKAIGEVLPMGTPRTKRGRDATRAFLDAHPAGDEARQ